MQPQATRTRASAWQGLSMAGLYYGSVCRAPSTSLVLPEQARRGATVLVPLAQSGWSPLYGMLKDRFGVAWVLDVAAPYEDN